MKCFVAITCLLALSASSKADDTSGLVYAPGHASVDYYAYPKYAFEYAVKDPHTGDNKAQWEKRDGDVVKGAYSLVEPDGTLRVVEYWADDKSGFNAVVKRVGPNLHPATIPVESIYKAPIPVLESHGPISPISIGSIAKYEGLAKAPLLSGPYHGGAISSASIYREPGPSVLKTPLAPILPAPIVPEPYIPSPIIKSAPYIPGPVIKPVNYYPGPLIKPASILDGHYSAPYLSAPLGGLGSSLLKALPVAGPGYYDGLGHDSWNKGPYLPLGGYEGIGGYKH